MTQEHPITPPPELVQQWLEKLLGGPVSYHSPSDQNILAAIAQWGADQELEACCEWLDYNCPSIGAHHLRAVRRPKPPSLKEQALALIDLIQGSEKVWSIRDLDVIRRALEQLPE